MQSFQRGFAFLEQSWRMALADRDLIKPSIFALAAGFFVTIIGLIPIGITGFFLSDLRIGQVIIYILGALLVFVHYLVSYVFSAMTVYLIYGYLSEGDGRMDKAWNIVRRDFLNILSLAAVSTVVNILKGGVRGRGRSGGRNMLAGLIETVWTEATYLILPAMVIEDIGLMDSVRRAGRIVRDNLLLIGVSTVGVRAITGLFGFLLGAVGIGLGFGIAFGLISITQGAVFGWVSGVTLGGLVASAFILTATLIGSYTLTAYHTCLYLWARDVEQAQSRGQSIEGIRAPEPLAAVLGD